MKNIFIFSISIFFGIVLFSCGGNKKKEEAKTTIADSLSPEIAAINAKIKADPKNPDLFNERAKLLTAKLKLDEALADMRTAMDIDSSKAAYFLTLSNIYFAMGKLSNCKNSIEKAMKLDPKNTDAYLQYAQVNLFFKDYKTAMENINKALEIDKINAKAYFMKGLTYEGAGDTVKAVSCFKTTVDQDPQYYYAYIQLGILYSMRKDPIAIDYFNDAIKQNPKSIDAIYGLGMYYQENEKYNEAIAEYDSIIHIDPKYKFAHYNLGYIHLVYLKVYSQAVKHFTNAIACDPNYAEAYYNRGYSYELMGDVQNAKTDYNKALELRHNYQKPIDGLNRIDKLIKVK
jgi:tetratricopeptide (TPR) repeat protein